MELVEQYLEVRKIRDNPWLYEYLNYREKVPRYQQEILRKLTEQRNKQQLRISEHFFEQQDIVNNQMRAIEQSLSNYLDEYVLMDFQNEPPYSIEFNNGSSIRIDSSVLTGGGNNGINRR